MQLIMGIGSAEEIALAETKAEAVISLAREAGYPLQAIVEEA